VKNVEETPKFGKQKTVIHMVYAETQQFINQCVRM